MNIIAAVTGNNALEVIFIDANGLPHLFSLDAAQNWSDDGPLANSNPPVQFALIAAAACPDGSVQVVGLTGSEADPPFCISQDPGGNWSWQGQLPIDPIAGFIDVQAGLGNNGNLQVVLLSNVDNLLNLVWRGADGIWNEYEYGPNPNSPSELPSGGVQFSTFAMGVGNGGRLQVIGVGLDDNLPYLIWQDIDGTWNWYGKLPNADPPVPFSVVATGVGNGGQLQVVGFGKDDGQPYLIWQDLYGGWHWYGALPNPGGVGLSPPTPPFIPVTTGNGNNNYLQVIFFGTDSLPHLIWQDADGTWHPYVDPESGTNVLPNTLGGQLAPVAAGVNQGSLYVLSLIDAQPPLVYSVQDPSGVWAAGSA